MDKDFLEWLKSRAGEDGVGFDKVYLMTKAVWGINKKSKTTNIGMSESGYVLEMYSRTTAFPFYENDDSELKTLEKMLHFAYDKLKG